MSPIYLSYRDYCGDRSVLNEADPKWLHLLFTVLETGDDFQRTYNEHRFRCFSARGILDNKLRAKRLRFRHPENRRQRIEIVCTTGYDIDRKRADLIRLRAIEFLRPESLSNRVPEA